MMFIRAPVALVEFKEDLRTLSYAIGSAITGGALSILLGYCLKSSFWVLVYIVEFCIYLLLVLFDYLKRYRKKR